MATRAVSADAAVVEVLNARNYADWSVLVKTYLLAQDLWDVVEEEHEDDDEEEEEEADDKFKAWRKKNATALHKIQISCGQEAFSLISNTTSAKRAWDTLAEKFKPKLVRMVKTVVPADAIVVEDLNKDNYEHWSNNLVAQDLSEVVEATAEPPKPEEEAEADDKALMKKNATALHAIQVSCGPDAFSVIKETSSAKIDRDTLAEKFTPQPSLLNNSFFQSASSSSNPGSYEENKPLFDAVWSGDWNKAKKFLTERPNAIKARLPYTDKMALHFATELEHEHIVEELVQLMSEEDLEITDNWGQTALALAAKRGNRKMVKCMVRKSKKTLSIPTKTRNRTPIILAAMNEQWDVVKDLYFVTPLQDLKPDKGPYGAGLLRYFIVGMKFDIALELIQLCPELVFTKGQNGKFPMEGFMPSAFLSGTPLNFLQRRIYNCIHVERAINDIRVSVQNEGNEESNPMKITCSGVHIEPTISDTRVRVQSEGNEECNRQKISVSGINRIREIKQAHIQSLELLHHMREVIKHRHHHDYVRQAIFRAIELGMFEFTDSVLQARPNLIWLSNQAGRNLVHFAIECRQEKIYSLIINRLDERERKLIGNIADMSGNCALHVAGMLSKFAKLNDISGAALQMQRELQWFKEVETIGLPRLKERRNKDHMTPRELFTDNHKELVKEGERWMKETATSCTVVGALIITIMFAAAFTVPGGNNGETGFPIFLHKNLFMAFIVLDAISLFSSTTSVLMFLGILTSRYAENDFLKSLPTKMIIGLSTLIISIATMMGAFSFALFIMIHEHSWIVIPTIVLAIIPVILFSLTQCRLLVDMCISTYGRGIVDRKVKSRA
ncbi:hypothetical protein PRUPE_2G081200 [Prunus persica]|uniref:PGG domain-containing protein n=1 Tax=Prunus persica TaxID=3760 RepID=A0A251QD11_PRUPE|nr:hypothetical protein PRUPE_2G081200 [Prunus persica]